MSEQILSQQDTWASTSGDLIVEFVIISVGWSLQRRWSKPRRRQALRQL